MSVTALDHLIACQHALLRSFDLRDVDAIDRATADLRDAIAALQAPGAWEASDATRDKIDDAIKQSSAARIRVNYLAHWTRQKLDQLAELRSGKPVHTYAHWFKTRAKRAVD